MKFVTSRVTMLALWVSVASGCGESDTTPTGLGANESVQMGVFIVTASSHEFEGGALMTSEPCDRCDVSYFPVSSFYSAPIDEGSIAFVHSVHGDTLFAGSIWWMGVGVRTYPSTLISPTGFDAGAGPYELPGDLEVYGHDGARIPNAEVTSAMRSAWTAIDDLAVVGALLRGVSHVGVFEYVPGSPADLDTNRWVFMMYSRNP